MSLKRFVTMTAMAAALSIPVAAGLAQPATAPNPSAPPAAATPHAAAPATPQAAVPAATTQAARHMRDDQMRGSKLIGSTVYDSSDQKLGSIADLIVDRDGKITDVVVGLGDKHVGVPMADLKRGKDNHLVLSATKDSLKQMANFDLNYDAARSGSSTHK